MYSIINLIHKLLAAPVRKLGHWWNQASLKGYLQRKGVRFENDIRLNGRTLLNISKEAHVSIGRSFICNGGGTGIDAGIDSMIIVAKGATLTIGQGSGISNTSIHCYDSIIIGDHVNIGAGTKIFDTDFHSTRWQDREDRGLDIRNKKTAPVSIGSYVFIGTRCLIGKGVSIGDRSIVAAGSVVVKDIPPGQIWGGNPARFIKNAE